MVRYDDFSEQVTFTSIWAIDTNFAGSGSEGVSGSGVVSGSEVPSGSGNETDGLSGWSTSEDIVGSALVGTVLTVVVLCTVVGNVMVLLAVFVNSHLRSTTNYFIVNLAIADLLLGTTVLPFSASLEVFKKWLFGQVFCDIWAAIDVLCCTASIFSLCVISIDRYIGVTRPLQRSTIMTERRAFYVIIFIWLLAMAISIAPLVGWKEPASADPYECTVTTQTGYVIFSVSASFYIPLSIILLVYFRIYREAIKHSRFLTTGVKTTKVDESGVTLRVHKGGSPRVQYPQTPPNYQSNYRTVITANNAGVTTTTTATSSPGHQSSSSSDRSESSVGKLPLRMTAAGKVARFRRETKAAKTLGIVVGVFILCWFPFFFILPLGSLCHQCNIPPLLFNVFFWLGYCNSLMNPVIYACSSREFQFAFRRILRCKFRRRPRVFLNDQESSSGHDVNQIENSNSRGPRAQTNKSNRSAKKSKRQRQKYTKTFRSKTSSHRDDFDSINLQNFKTATSNNDLRFIESPTQSVQDLRQKIGEELLSNNALTGTEARCDWSRESLGCESVSNEDLVEGLTLESVSSAQCTTR